MKAVNLSSTAMIPTETVNPFTVGEKVSYRGQEATVANTTKYGVTLRLGANHFKTVLTSDVEVIRTTNR